MERDKNRKAKILCLSLSLSLKSIMSIVYNVSQLRFVYSVILLFNRLLIRLIIFHIQIRRYHIVIQRVCVCVFVWRYIHKVDQVFITKNSAITNTYLSNRLRIPIYVPYYQNS